MRWDGSDRPTTFVSSSEVDATIAASDLAAGKTVMITVRNPDTGVSNALAFTINNPVPTMASISPTTHLGRRRGFHAHRPGTNFVPNSVVRWNGNSRTTTYVSDTEVHGAILATDIASGGEAQVTVVNPAPAGGTSTPPSFPSPAIRASSSPTSATVTAGQSATYTVSLTPEYGSFDSAVSFSCVGLPNKCTATFSPATVTPGASAATTTMTLATQASSSSGGALSWARRASGRRPWGLWPSCRFSYWAGSTSEPPGGSSAAGWRRASLLCLILLVGSCSSGGGDNNPPAYTGTPKGTHAITVQAVAGTLTVTTPVTLVVN